MDIQTDLPEGGDATGSRRDKIVAAVKVWSGQLINLGGRNTLLFYRDLKQGTLDLSSISPALLADLVSGRPSRLSSLFGTDGQADAAKRARAIRAKARENFEERGLQTLYLACGMASWTNDSGAALPAAPVLLRPAQLTPRGGAAEDFDLVASGDLEVNPTLLHFLLTEHNVVVSPRELLTLLPEHDSVAVDPQPVYSRLERLAHAVPGFEVSHRVVLGNFSYAKLPMVRDLEGSADLLAENDLVAAIAGDPGAREAIRERDEVRADLPDRVPPADEFLVLDADASQSVAINSVISGGHLVIEGPPGTGKSQTIANLIATLAARGKRVLFVAEKRAAIDAVLVRLEKVGLADLVMDLHDGVGNKRRIAQNLQAALVRAGRVPLPAVAAQHQALERRRNELIDHATAMHMERQPWGFSVYQLQAVLIGIARSHQSAKRIRGNALLSIDREALQSATDDINRLAELGGLEIAHGSRPWASSLGRITTDEKAAEALHVVTRLFAETLPKAVRSLTRVLEQVDLQGPSSMEDWPRLLALLSGIDETLTRYSSGVFDAAASAAERLKVADRGKFARLKAALGNPMYRRARKHMRSMRTSSASALELFKEATQAKDQLDQWKARSKSVGAPRVPTDLSGAIASHQQLTLELRALSSLLGVTFDGVSPADLELLLSELVRDQTTLYKLPELHERMTRVDRMGFGELLSDLAGRQLSPEGAVECLTFVVLSSILEHVCVTDRRIGSFDGAVHSRAVELFKSLDVAHVESTPERVRRNWAERLTNIRDQYRAEADAVAKQAGLKRNHMAMRALFQAAPNVLTAIKPCWALSPLMVSQLLPADRCFDVVVFDEASQVRPADAVGALMRADVAVVAGDTKQLPPTAFFLAGVDGEGDATDAEDLALTQDFESILEVMRTLLPGGTRTLAWHYRSHDERLIAFSNAQPNLYDWSLTTFPGITADGCLSHVLVPFRNGVVGQEESASDEVSRVVELIMEHAVSRPGESLGVIAMGIKHADRISEALRRLRGHRPDLDAFFDESAPEPFFIKNLERVQGDERDAIILSVGYGKNTEGRMLYRFGPLNIEGGERRLNVAVTRSRRRMTVVSSFAAKDMDTERLRAEGAKMLQRYLAYAETRGSDLGRAAISKPVMNPFERDVHGRLTAAGLPLIAQYGCSGYWIDFAAKHPRRPGQMVLAIECDGASYHSSETARDRDRLRQEHLERLGWRFHRIWSTDWFRDPESQVQRAVDAYRKAVENGVSAPLQREAAAELKPISGGSAEQVIRTGRPGVRRGLPIDDYSTQEIVALVRWIESDTLLRTEDQLLVEVMEALGFQRRGSKIVSRIQAAITVARRG